MLHKTRARNARPYGYGGIMRSSFFRNIVGAHRAPLLNLCKISICSFTVKKFIYSFHLQKAILPLQGGE